MDPVAATETTLAVRSRTQVRLITLRFAITLSVTPNTSRKKDFPYSYDGEGLAMPNYVIAPTEIETTEIAIGELSRRTGVHIETIRYYERIKMLPKPPRTVGGRRTYGSTHVRLLAFIKR